MLRWWLKRIICADDETPLRERREDFSPRGAGSNVHDVKSAKLQNARVWLQAALPSRQWLGIAGFLIRNTFCKGASANTTIMSPTSNSPDESDTFIPPTGPPPHEDLTIAELLEIMRDPSQDRPGELCFLDENELPRWVAEVELADFLTSSGALHPSGFLNTHGVDWKIRLFGKL
jgi:hypothetical protein